MKKYLAHIKQKAPHERRQVAMRIAGSITAVIFVGWVATLGVRLASPNANVVQQTSTFTSQLASVVSAFKLPGQATGNTLQVASTTNF
jgi:hypothetical protein